MTFIAGFFLGALVTIRTAFIFSGNDDELDDDNKINYD